MKQLGKILLVAMSFLFLLSACSMRYQQLDVTKNQKNIEYFAMFSDPIIRKDFRAFKATAINAHLDQVNGKILISPQDTRKLNEITARIISRLHYYYHVDPVKHKLHTYIGKNEFNSCYQYYNSFDHDSVGKDCRQFSYSFASCGLCDQFIKAVRSRPTTNIIHSQWWGNDKTTVLVSTTKLRNGDKVYVGLELSA